MMQGRKSITKSELAEMYGISRETLRRLLNIRYYERLESAGYKKTTRIIEPKVVQVFIDIYGEPF